MGSLNFDTIDFDCRDFDASALFYTWCQVIFQIQHIQSRISFSFLLTGSTYRISREQ